MGQIFRVKDGTGQYCRNSRYGRALNNEYRTAIVMKRVTSNFLGKDGGTGGGVAVMKVTPE